MAKHTPEGKARNKALYELYLHQQENADKKRAEIASLIKESIFGELQDKTLHDLDCLTHMWNYHNEQAELAWERYHDHCTTFDYEVR